MTMTVCDKLTKSPTVPSLGQPLSFHASPYTTVIGHLTRLQVTSRLDLPDLVCSPQSVSALFYHNPQKDNMPGKRRIHICPTCKRRTSRFHRRRKFFERDIRRASAILECDDAVNVSINAIFSAHNCDVTKAGDFCGYKAPSLHTERNGKPRNFARTSV